MSGKVRTKMVEGAVRLLAQKGLQATSFAEVLDLTGAPRGSVYHHFPQGKDQMVAEAVALAGDRALAYLETKAGAGAVEITEYFLFLWREVLSRSGFRAGCAVLAVTVATDSPDLLARTSEVFRAWRKRLAELFSAGGLDTVSADRFAATLIAASEGAVVLSRAEQSLEPFNLVADQLVAQVKMMVGARPSSE